MTRVRSYRLVIAAAAALSVVLGLTLTGTAAAVPASDGVESVPVSFDVVTSNRSGVPCLTTPGEQRLTVRGHLTGPASKLRNGVEGALFAHGNGYGEFFYRFGDPKYNVVDDLAGRGHVSVTIDRLGYGASDKPSGNGICFGTEADVLHQIVGQLRDGRYGGKLTPSFDRVALLGHSAGGVIAEQEAAGFGDIDALGVLSSGDLNATPLVAQRTAEMQMRCLTELLGDGYAPLEANEAQFRADHLYNIDPEVADKVAGRRTDDACAGTRNAGQAIAADTVRNNMITVPVLFLIGKNDAFFGGDTAAQVATYSQSRKVTVTELDDTGHAVAFGRTAPEWRDAVHNWLKDNGF